MNRSNRAAGSVARYLEWFHIGRYVDALVLKVNCDH